MFRTVGDADAVAISACGASLCAGIVQGRDFAPAGGRSAERWIGASVALIGEDDEELQVIAEILEVLGAQT